MSWYPNADRSVTATDAGTYLGGPAKGVLHTTEGPSGDGAISAFRGSNSWPHFLVDYVGKVWQFLDTAHAARALQNLPGGVETNRDHAIQIEIVGFAGQPGNHPRAQLDALRSLMRWIESVEGVKPKGPGVPFADHYGQSGIRFSGPVWDNFDGWCGHCHVPENDHWDPGAIDLNALLPSPPPPPSQGVKPMYNPPILLGEVVASLPRPGGVVLLNRQGDIYAFNCRDAGAPGRHPEYWNRNTDRAASLAPLGENGYYVAKEGADVTPGGSGWYAYP